MLYFKKKVFIYRLSQGSVAALTFPLDVASGDNSLVAECRLERTLWWPLLLRSTGSGSFSSCASRALGHRLSSCGERLLL